MPDPTTFFENDLPRICQRKELLLESQPRAILKFTIAGIGSWALAFGPNVGERVRKGPISERDGHLFCSPTAFTQLLDGELDVSAAMASGQFRFFGDENTLASLAALLTPAQDAVSVRMQP